MQLARMWAGEAWHDRGRRHQGKANASRHKAMSYKRMKPAEDELHCEIKALLDRAKATDDRSVTSRSWTFLPRFLAAKRRRRSRRQRRAWKRASVKRTRPGAQRDDGRRPRHPDGSDKGGGSYKREFGVPDDRDQESFTDPDSRIMKHAGGGSSRATTGTQRSMPSTRSSWRRS
uniref:Uncharacterized protein n=1 Tax=Klebsiella pneumoniae TaxID=573 RepID=A0A2P1BNI5_KLEPN|nr:hypothetical protein [Klebsiella pneumoniae]